MTHPKRRTKVSAGSKAKSRSRGTGRLASSTEVGRKAGPEKNPTDKASFRGPTNARPKPNVAKKVAGGRPIASKPKQTSLEGKQRNTEGSAERRGVAPRGTLSNKKRGTSAEGPRSRGRTRKGVQLIDKPEEPVEREKIPDDGISNTQLCRALQWFLDGSSTPWYELMESLREETQAAETEYKTYEDEQELSDELHLRGGRLLRRCRLHLPSIESKVADWAWARSLTRQGTLQDKFSALATLIEKAPVPRLYDIQVLMGAMQAKNRTATLQAANFCQELLTGPHLLPPDRCLRTFDRMARQYGLIQSSGKRVKTPVIKSDGCWLRLLLCLHFESELRSCVHKVVLRLEALQKDTILVVRKRAIDFAYEMVCMKPEDDERVLGIVLKGLCDQQAKVSSLAANSLAKLLLVQPMMKTAVCDRLENFIWNQKVSVQALWLRDGVKLNRLERRRKRRLKAAKNQLTHLIRDEEGDENSSDHLMKAKASTRHAFQSVSNCLQFLADIQYNPTRDPQDFIPKSLLRYQRLIKAMLKDSEEFKKASRRVQKAHAKIIAVAESQKRRLKLADQPLAKRAKQEPGEDSETSHDDASDEPAESIDSRKGRRTDTKPARSSDQDVSTADSSDSEDELVGEADAPVPEDALRSEVQRLLLGGLDPEDSEAPNFRGVKTNPLDANSPAERPLFKRKPVSVEPDDLPALSPESIEELSESVKLDRQALLPYITGLALTKEGHGCLRSILVGLRRLLPFCSTLTISRHLSAERAIVDQLMALNHQVQSWSVRVAGWDFLYRLLVRTGNLQTTHLANFYAQLRDLEYGRCQSRSELISLVCDIIRNHRIDEAVRLSFVRRLLCWASCSFEPPGSIFLIFDLLERSLRTNANMNLFNFLSAESELSDAALMSAPQQQRKQSREVKSEGKSEEGKRKGTNKKGEVQMKSETSTGGKWTGYDPSCFNPAQANADRSQVWELSILRCSVFPEVRAAVDGLLGSEIVYPSDDFDYDESLIDPPSRSSMAAFDQMIPFNEDDQHNDRQEKLRKLRSCMEDSLSFGGFVKLLNGRSLRAAFHFKAKDEQGDDSDESDEDGIDDDLVGPSESVFKEAESSDDSISDSDEDFDDEDFVERAAKQSDNTFEEADNTFEEAGPTSSYTADSDEDSFDLSDPFKELEAHSDSDSEKKPESSTALQGDNSGDEMDSDEDEDLIDEEDELAALESGKGFVRSRVAAKKQKEPKNPWNCSIHHRRLWESDLNFPFRKLFEPVFGSKV